jgi:hypothetical protein
VLGDDSFAAEAGDDRDPVALDPFHEGAAEAISASRAPEPMKMSGRRADMSRWYTSRIARGDHDRRSSGSPGPAGPSRGVLNSLERRSGDIRGDRQVHGCARTTVKHRESAPELPHEAARLDDACAVCRRMAKSTDDQSTPDSVVLSCIAPNPHLSVGTCPGDQQDRHAVEVRRRESGHRVGRPRSRRSPDKHRALPLARA